MDRQSKQYLTDTFFPGTEPIIRKIVEQSPVLHDKTVVHIPARSGSSRLPDKNIKPLGGKPLLAYSVLLARELGADRVIVNTDSLKYADIAREYGAEVPFLRPAELSRDSTPPGFASYYAQKRLLMEGYPVGFWIEMYPTTPFRNVHKLRGYLQELRRAGSITTAFSPAGSLAGFRHGDRAVRLENAERYADTHAFYKVLSNFIGHALDARRSRWRQYALITDPVELIDIDTDEDFSLAEAVLTSGCYDFGMPLC